MALALTDDHLALADTVADFLGRHKARMVSRSLLETPEAPNPPYHAEAAALGWLGLHVPEAHGGSGYSLEEAVVIAEQLGRGLASGAFVPSMIAAGVLSVAGTDELKNALLPRLADGSASGAVALASSAELKAGKLHGSGGVVLCASIADVLLVPVGDDVAVVETSAAGVTITTPPNMDPTRRSSRVMFDGVDAKVIPGAARALEDIARTLFAAEATGVARECTEAAAEYAKVRIQFGRPIAMYQAVKHHCANMSVATELATAAVWDAARAAEAGGAQFALTASIAATSALDAARLCTNLNTQVHGGIGFTWEHDAHLYMRRAEALAAILDAEAAAEFASSAVRAGVKREKTVALPPEAEAIRAEVVAFAESVKDLDRKARKVKLIDEGYAMPHWPKPFGRDAGAIEQLVIEQEFAKAGIDRPGYGITGWVILTLIQHGTDDQVARWVRPALEQEVIWCQLFSEPDAGSDAAGVKTKATRVDGGWLVNGQKVWTSGAHIAKRGFATVRTNPDLPKHQGITTMVIDMESSDVEVRPLRQATGGADFNEVFFNDVFVPDDDVVGPVDGGWTVARATLGNESVSIGGGGGGMTVPASSLLAAYDANPNRLPGGQARIGRYIAASHGMAMLNLRSAHRAVAGNEPGPEGAITKLVLSELGHEAAAIGATLAGSESAFLDGATAMTGMLVLGHRGMSIAGGTSEIKRNQIGERILGLPRDPLIK